MRLHRFAGSGFADPVPVMAERIAYYGGESLPYIVTANDGTLFECVAERTDVGEARWVFYATDGSRHVGPLASAAAFTDDLHHVVSVWWQQQKRLSTRARVRDI
jgi:hypothetical protein